MGLRILIHKSTVDVTHLKTLSDQNPTCLAFIFNILTIRGRRFSLWHTGHNETQLLNIAMSHLCIYDKWRLSTPASYKKTTAGVFWPHLKIMLM